MVLSSREIRYRVDGKFISTPPVAFAKFTELKSYLYQRDPRVGYPTKVMACVRKTGSQDEGAWVPEGYYCNIIPDGEEYC
jgi:hypothetical protein